MSNAHDRFATNGGRGALLVLLALALQVPAAWGQGAFTCSTVAARGQLDPAGSGFWFSNRFGDDAVVNRFGDAAFTASPKSLAQSRVQTVYYYPIAGPGEVVVRQGDAAPGGGVFSNVVRTCFSGLCLNDASDLGFAARLVAGEGVYARVGGGPLVDVVRTTDPSPGGGTFESFPAFAGCNSSADMAFVGQVVDGPDGLFLWDSGTQTVSAVRLVGDSTGSGRQFCEFGDLSISDAGIGFRAVTRPDCSGPGGELEGVFAWDPGGVTTIALENDPAPIGGTTFRRFLKNDRTDINNDGDVTFAAFAVGALALQAVFFYDAGTSAITTTAVQYDLAPGTAGGILRKLEAQRVTDTDVSFVKAKLRGTPGKQGILVYDAVPYAAVLKLDPAPTDAFGAGATYRGFKGRGMSVSDDGTWLAFTALVKDPVPPRKKRAVLRCAAP